MSMYGGFELVGSIGTNLPRNDVQITTSSGYTVDTLRPIFDKAMGNGLSLWDTAYAYGMGTSEKVLAGFVKELESVADSLGLNVIRGWEKEMK